MNENVIYRQKFTGKRTGWAYELWLIPSGTTEFTDFPFIEVPYDTFKVKTADTGFDKRTMGSLKLPILEIDHDMTLVPLHTDYDLLRTMILNPSWKYAPSGYTSAIQSGTLYLLFCTGAGYSDELLFAGIQQSPANGDYDLKNQKLKIKVSEIMVTIQNSINMHDVAVKYLEYLDAHGSVVVSKNCYFNSISLNGGSNDCIIMRPPQDYTYYFAPRQIIWDSIALILKAFYDALGRGLITLTSGFSVQSPLGTNYKQKYDGTGGTNGELTEVDLMILVCVGKPVTNMFDGLNLVAQNEWKGGYLDYKEERGLFNVHTCVYDFMKDNYEDSLCKGIYNYTGLAMLSIPIYNSLTDDLTGEAIDGQYTTDDPLAIDLSRSYKIDYKDSDSRVSSASSSLSFTLEGDIQKYDSKSSASQNDTSENIPIMFNNMPEVIDYEEYTYYLANTRWHLDVAFNIADLGAIAISSDTKSGLEHINGLFYLETGSPFTASNIVRVSEQMSTGVADSVYTGNLPSCSLDSFPITDKIDSSAGLSKFAIKPLMLDMQLTTCKPRIQADAFKQIFKSHNQAVIGIQIELDLGGAKPNSWWLRGFTKKYSINIGDLYPQLAYLSTNGWFMLSTKIDFETELAEIDLINATYDEV